MREFKSIWFGGDPNNSEFRAERLREILEEALTLLSMMQQPPRPNSEDNAEAFEEEYEKSEQRVKEIAQDISCALTGKPK